MFKLLAKPLSIDDQNNLVSEKLDWILKCCRPTKVILFGSAARYEMTDASDIDLVLIFPDTVDLSIIKESVFKSRPRDDWPHDLLFFTESQFIKSCASGGGVAYLAQNEGRTLFQRDPS